MRIDPESHTALCSTLAVFLRHKAFEVTIVDSTLNSKKKVKYVYLMKSSSVLSDCTRFW